MQRIKRFNRYVSLQANKPLTLGCGKMRTVRMDFLAPEETKVFAKGGDGGAKAWQFIAIVKGNETVEIGWHGPLMIKAESPVSIYSSEMEKTEITIENPEIFTRVLNRRKRNPEMERMMFEMQRNIENRVATQLGEIERRYGKDARNEYAKEERKRRRHVHVDGVSERDDLKASDPSDAEEEPSKSDVVVDESESGSGTRSTKASSAEGSAKVAQ